MAKILKEYRGVGKDHGDIPRPNGKEPSYNVSPRTVETYRNKDIIRRAWPDKIS